MFRVRLVVSGRGAGEPVTDVKEAQHGRILSRGCHLENLPLDDAVKIVADLAAMMGLNSRLLYNALLTWLLKVAHKKSQPVMSWSGPLGFRTLNSPVDTQLHSVTLRLQPGDEDDDLDDVVAIG